MGLSTTRYGPTAPIVGQCPGKRRRTILADPFLTVTDGSFGVDHLLLRHAPTYGDIEVRTDRFSVGLRWHKGRLLNRREARLIESGEASGLANCNVGSRAICPYVSMNRAISLFVHLSRLRRVLIWADLELVLFAYFRDQEGIKARSRRRLP
jgi:hypothetical protein